MSVEIEKAASALGTASGESRADRAELNRLMAHLLRCVHPTTPLEERALARAKKIIARRRIKEVAAIGV